LTLTELVIILNGYELLDIQKYYEKNSMWCLERQKGLESLWHGLRITNMIEKAFQWVKK